MSLFRQDTVDSVISSMSVTVQKLRALKDKHAADAVYNGQLANEYAAKADDSQKESLRADAIATKIGALLEP